MTIYTYDYNAQDYVDVFKENMCPDSEIDMSLAVHQNELEEYAYEEKQYEWLTLLTELSEYEAVHDKTYVVKAIIGTWCGPKDGGKIITGLDKVFTLCGEDFNNIYTWKNLLCFEAAHHDGTNIFKIKELTDRGLRFFERHEYELDDREMVEKLFNDRHLSRNVTAFKTMWGC